MTNLIMRSNAKINICLDIKGKRADGYHILDMVMLPIEMHDTLIISELKSTVDNFVTIDDFSNGCIEYNLASLAIQKLAEKRGFKNKFRITIHKVLPIQAGLGGGSSNAAAALKGVNQYLKLGCTDEELIDISKDLGADIPFFIKNKPMRCQGIGEIMEPVQVKNNYFVIIVKPKDGCGTKAIYEISDKMDLVTGDVDKVIKALAEGDDETLANSIFNSLQEPAIKKVPEIANIISLLKENGLKIVQVTGSGSAVFGMSTDKKLINTVAKKIDELDKYFVDVTKILK